MEAVSNSTQIIKYIKKSRNKCIDRHIETECWNKKYCSNSKEFVCTV